MDAQENEAEPPKLEESQDVPNLTPTPTFAGRLNMANFSYTSTSSHNSKPPNTSKRAQPSSPQNPNTTTKKRKSSHLSPSPSPSKNPTPSPSPSPLKKSGYAPPSTYAHLPPLPDILPSGLLCVFIGLNPGLQTSIQGHAYAHPSNRFWKLLHSSGLTTRLCRPDEDRSLPVLFSLGNTNIVARPTRNGAELSKKEMDAGVSVLEQKIRTCKPEAVAIVGKSIWESVFRVRNGRNIKKEEFRYGWQDDSVRMGVIEGEGGGGWEGARVFVATSTSGLAAGVPYAEKARIWRNLGVWVERRREERAVKQSGSDGDVKVEDGERREDEYQDVPSLKKEEQ